MVTRGTKATVVKTETDDIAMTTSAQVSRVKVEPGSKTGIDIKPEQGTEEADAPTEQAIRQTLRGLKAYQQQLKKLLGPIAGDKRKRQVQEDE